VSALRSGLLRLISLIVRLLPGERREWGRAIAAEAVAIDSPAELLAWLLGALRVLVRTRASQAYRHHRSRRLQAVAVLSAAAIVAVVVAGSGRAGHRAASATRPIALPRGSMVIAPATPRHPEVIGRAAHGTPYGPAIHRLRTITAAWLECDYAHGARRHATGGSSNAFTVTGTSPAGHRACAPLQAAATQLQRTQAYADDAAATALFVERARACVQAQGISLSTRGAAVAERACQAQLEARLAITEPLPLP
jgi:hypothetical protein